MEQNTWYGVVRIATEPERLSDDTLDALLAVTGSEAATVDPRTPGRLVLRFDLEANGYKAAETEVADIARRAIRAVPGDPVVIGSGLTRHDEHHRLLVHPEPMELVGNAGAAHILGVSRQRVLQLRQEDPDFPTPIGEATGPIYSAVSIRAYKARREAR